MKRKLLNIFIIIMVKTNEVVWKSENVKYVINHLKIGKLCFILQF